MSASLRKKSELHGVELDPITSQIGWQHYTQVPKLPRQQGFQDFQVPAEYFDLVIGNPPFGNEPILLIMIVVHIQVHLFIIISFAKSVDKLRPGGILAMVVSVILWMPEPTIPVNGLLNVLIL